MQAGLFVLEHNVPAYQLVLTWRETGLRCTIMCHPQQSCQLVKPWHVKRDQSVPCDVTLWLVRYTPSNFSMLKITVVAEGVVLGVHHCFAIHCAHICVVWALRIQPLPLGSFKWGLYHELVKGTDQSAWVYHALDHCPLTVRMSELWLVQALESPALAVERSLC